MTDRYAEGLRRPLGWSEAFQIAERGFKAWAEKEHNRKWFKRIDGTPIPNDLLVNIAQAFADASIPPDPPPMASEDEAIRALLNLRFYRPPDFGSHDEIIAARNELDKQGDMRVVYVNEGDWILVELARAALAKAKGAMIDCALSEPSS